MRVKAQLGILLNKCSRAKFTILYVIILIFSIYIVGNIVYSIRYPLKYPTKNLDAIIRTRSLGFDEHSSIIVTDAPILSKQSIDVIISSLYEMEVNWIIEINIFGDTIVGFEDFLFLKSEDVFNIEIYLDGKAIDYYHVTHEGEEYYAFRGFNITEINKIYKLETIFHIKRISGKSELTRIPLMFNKKYAKLIRLPTLSMPLHNGSVSGIHRVHIDFGLPFQEILIKQSGWVERYAPPKNEWELMKTDPNEYQIYKFDYPLPQDITRDRNSYIFETKFSNENIATSISLIIIPEYRVLFIIIIFLLSPIYIPLFKWLENRKINENSKMNSNKSIEHILKISKIYWVLLFTLLMNVLFGESPLLFWKYIFEITNLIAFVFIWLSPLFTYIIYNRVLDERNS